VPPPRHPLKSALAFGRFSNPPILIGIAAELGLLLLIVYTPACWLFGTAPVAQVTRHVQQASLP
jgi:sodium/potassium-transporting ATPase subunit alpha